MTFDTSFEAAQPSFTHKALLALMKAGFMHYIVSQNVDGLHIKSGVPRDKLSELHGNIFAEQCDACNTEYIRGQRAWHTQRLRSWTMAC